MFSLYPYHTHCISSFLSSPSSCKRPTVCMGRQQGLPFCTVCGYRCSSPERTRGRCAVGKVRVAGGGGALGGGAGMRCCGCRERSRGRNLPLPPNCEGAPRGGRAGSPGGRNRGARSLRVAGSRGVLGGERPQPALPAHCGVTRPLCSGPPLSSGLQAVSFLPGRFCATSFIQNLDQQMNIQVGKGCLEGWRGFQAGAHLRGPLKGNKGDLKPGFQLGHPFLFCLFSFLKKYKQRA